MDHNSLFTLKYSLSEWKELEYRKLVNDYLNCLILSDKFLIWERRLACEWMELEYRKPVNVFFKLLLSDKFLVWEGRLLKTLVPK